MTPRRRLGSASGEPLRTGSAVAGLTGVRTLAGGLVDLTVADGRVTSTAPHGVADEATGVILDASGWVVLPAAAEPHAHLDKALAAPAAGDPGGLDLAGAVACWGRVASSLDRDDVRRRAREMLERYAVRGVTAVRSHVGLPASGDPFVALDALLDVRRELDGRMVLQLCTLAGSDTPDEVVLEAHRRGADVVGGCPHLAPDPAGEVRRALDLGQRLGLPVDLHADERTDVDSLDLAVLVDEVAARGLRDGVPAGGRVAGVPGSTSHHRITASHAVRLGSLPVAGRDELLAAVSAVGIALITLPITNLYLQGRDGRVPAARGLPPLRAVLDAGVLLAAGGDNVRDPFNPVGRADPFETTSLLVVAGHLTLQEALHAVTGAAREVLDLVPAGTEVGEAADLVLVPDAPLGDVVAGTQDARIVIAAGRVLADTRVRRAVGLFGNALADEREPMDAGPSAGADHVPTPDRDLVRFP